MPKAGDFKLQFCSIRFLLHARYARDLFSAEQEVGILEVAAGTARAHVPGAAVDNELVGRDVVAGVGEEVYRGVRDFLDAAPAADGDVLAGVLAGLLFLRQSVHAFCVGNGAGRDDVRGHAQRAVFDGHVG